jgi:hypothetical protein
VDKHLTMKNRWVVTCDDCGNDGPPSATSPGARQRAAGQKWAIGQDAANGNGRGADYCDTCVLLHDIKYCQGKDKTGACETKAMYELVMFNEDGSRFGQGEPLYGCGKHYGAMLKELFNSRPTQPLMMWRLRDAVHVEVRTDAG